MIRICLAAADLGALQRDAVAVGTQFQVVADMHGRRQEAHVLREFLADALDAPQQVAVLGFVYQRDQAIADFQSEHVDLRHIFPAGFRRFVLGASAGFAASAALSSSSLVRCQQAVGEPAQRAASSRKAKCGMPGIMPSMPMMAAVMMSTCGLENNCLASC